MKLATAKDFVFGYLLVLFIGGCESTENPPATNQSASATNYIAVTQKRIITTPSPIEKKSFDAINQPRATNSISSPLIKYDQTLVSQIEKKWSEHVQNAQVTLNQGVVVILKFHLNSDGTINDINVIKSTADESLVSMCKKVLAEISPYKPWPDDMKKMVGKDYREMTFTFNY